MTAWFHIFTNSSFTDTALQRRPEKHWSTTELLVQCKITLSLDVEVQVSGFETKSYTRICWLSLPAPTPPTSSEDLAANLSGTTMVMHCALPTQLFPTSPDDVCLFHEYPSVDSSCSQLCIITYCIALKDWAREYLLDFNKRHSCFWLKIDLNKSMGLYGLAF